VETVQQQTVSRHGVEIDSFTSVTHTVLSVQMPSVMMNAMPSFLVMAAAVMVIMSSVRIQSAD
jgi:hypothetical protein